MRKAFRCFLVFFLCALMLCVFASPEAWAKSKKKKSKKASQPRMNGVEAIIRAQENGESVELVDPDNPKKKIVVEAPKDGKKKKQKEEKDQKKTAKEEPRIVLEPEAAEQAMAETQAVLAPPVIVIDAGHGGKDPGAQGVFGKGKKKTIVREKDVVLQIAKQLAAALKKKLGAKVSFTRANDVFVTLGERDRIANRRQADLFLSVHANAAKNPDARGLEIYYLNKATDEASQRLASRENEGAPKQGQDLEEILSDLLQTAATEESAVLAGEVKRSFRKSLVDKYDIERLEVKTALFYVLVGAKCPSLLIETGFVTNAEEGKRLKQVAYQKDMANAIADAVARYWKSSQEKGDL
ncbi:MAG TPA: N-acetylmuramoyl-L-alanine amidase [bacterium]|nr:N-acetylmuramoyl-L-alanine amidase [bacterium]